MKKIVNPPLSLHWATTSLLWQDIRRAAALAGQVDRAMHERMFVFRFWCVLYRSARRLSYLPGGVRTRVLGTLEKGKGGCGGTWASSAGLGGKPATNLHIWTLEVFLKLIKGIYQISKSSASLSKSYFVSLQIGQWLACNEKSNHKRPPWTDSQHTDCLLPSYGKWLGLLWSCSAMTTEKTDRGKTIRAHQPLPSHLYLPQSQRDEN